MSVTTSRMHIKQLNHKILQVKVNTMRSSDILSQRPQHLCTGVYTSKLMRPVHSKVEVRLMKQMRLVAFYAIPRHPKDFIYI